MLEDYQNIKICIFDFDGTLVDTMNSFADIAASIIKKKYKMPFNKARQLYLDTSGLPFIEQLRVLFPNRSENSILANEFEEKKKTGFFLEHFSDDVKMTIESLKKMKIKTAISSNNFQNMIEMFVKKESVTFDYILGYKEDFSKGIDHFNFISYKTNCLLENMVFVGDSLNDAKIAVDTNIKFIAKLGTFSKNDFNNKFPQFMTVNKLYEIIKVFI